MVVSHIEEQYILDEYKSLKNGINVSGKILILSDITFASFHGPGLRKFGMPVRLHSVICCCFPVGYHVITRRCLHSNPRGWVENVPGLPPTHSAHRRGYWEVAGHAGDNIRAWGGEQYGVNFLHRDLCEQPPMADAVDLLHHL